MNDNLTAGVIMLCVFIYLVFYKDDDDDLSSA